MMTSAKNEGAPPQVVGGRRTRRQPVILIRSRRDRTRDGRRWRSHAQPVTSGGRP
jgi:hypothetical protein